MPYVGNKPEVGNFRKCDAITTSATATYNLLVGGVAVNPNQNQCIVSLNGVIQSSGNSYTIASSQITFSQALTSSDVIDFILILGDTLDVGVPSDNTISTAKLQANAVTSAKIASGVVPTLRPNVSPLLINGDFAIAQRGISQANIASNGGYKTVDRWQVNNQGSFVGDATVSQSTDAPSGFKTSLKFDCTTAASASANSGVHFEQRIEAQDCQLLKLGNSDAEKITISFWVKATKTGTNIVRLEQEDVQRQCSQSYTVSSSNTWEKKTVVFPADTSGSGITNDNGIGLELWFYLAAGSNYTSGTLATSWEAVSGNDDNKAVGQVNNMDNTSNDFIITGVQMEVGEYTSSTIPYFQHESFGDNLARCQRYYQLVQNWSGGVVNSSTAYINATFWKTMRTTPSVTTTGALNGNDIVNNVNQSSGQVTLHGANENGFWGGIGNFSSLTTNNPFNSRFQNTNKLAFSSEL
jgi:hypothetical protein